MNLKKQAAKRALEYLKNDMVFGLGTGSTITFLIEFLGEALKEGLFKNIIAIPTSLDTAYKAKSFGITLGSLDQYERLDLALDGADEVDPQLNLIKGLGRALLREKLVEMHAEHFVVLVDESKVVNLLGTHSALPIEIVPFGATAHVRWLNTLGCRAELWVEENGEPAITDNGNYLAKCFFSNGISDPYKLARELDSHPGIIEHGLFLDMAHEVIVAGDAGVRIMQKN